MFVILATTFIPLIDNDYQQTAFIQSRIFITTASFVTMSMILRIA